MKWDINKVATLFGIILPLWGGAVFLWNYEKSLVKKADLSMEMESGFKQLLYERKQYGKS